MKFLMIYFLSLVMMLPSMALGASSLNDLFGNSGANRAGRCPNGTYINPAKSQTCEYSELPSPAILKTLKDDVSGATCDLNELLNVKESLMYILDQFYCSQRGTQAAVCAVGAALPVYAGLRMKSGFRLPELFDQKKEYKMFVKEINDELASGAKNLTEIYKKSGAVGKTAENLAHRELTGVRKYWLTQIKNADAEIAAKGAKKILAAKLASKLALGTSGIGVALLAADVLDLSMSPAGAPTLSDRYKTIQGFVDFTKLSDKEKCVELSSGTNDLRVHFLKMSLKLQNQLNDNLPMETIVQCGPDGGSTFALFKNRDGTSRMRSYDFDLQGRVKSLSGYELAMPMMAQDDLNFKIAAKQNSSGKEGFSKKTFYVAVGENSVIYPEPGSQKKVLDTDSFLSDKEMQIVTESRRMSMMAPSIYHFCNHRKMSSSVGERTRSSKSGTISGGASK